MNKIQKTWLWVSILMFLIPEIFFSSITSFFASLCGVINFPFFYERFIDSQFFIDNPGYLFIVLFIEFLGVLGLLIYNIKFNNHKYKIVFSIILTLVLAFLILIFFVGYAVTNMSFP